MEYHEIANIFPMMSEEEYKALLEDMRQNGQLEAIVVYEDKILDGRNRYKACLELGLKPKMVDFSGNNPLSFVISKNLKRRHLTASQQAVIALEVLPMLEEEARKRQAIGHFNAPQYKDRPVGKLVDQLEEGRSREKAAALFGINSQYIADAKMIAKKAPEKLDEIRTGEKTIKKAVQEIKFAERLEKAKVVPLPEDKFEVIYADPPWQYDNSGFDQNAASIYPTMSLEAIKNMNIENLCDENTVLFLWATSPLLPGALEVMAAWGFTYRASMVWIKDRAPGMGWWVNTKHELLLIGSKNTNHPLKKFDSIINAPVTNHSHKPEIVYSMIEEMYFGKKIELFARNARQGWEVWGNGI